LIVSMAMRIAAQAPSRYQLGAARQGRALGKRARISQVVANGAGKWSLFGFANRRAGDASADDAAVLRVAAPVAILLGGDRLDAGDVARRQGVLAGALDDEPPVPGIGPERRIDVAALGCVHEDRMRMAVQVDHGDQPLHAAVADALVRVQEGLLGGVDVEDHAPDNIRRLAGEERVALAGAVVAPLVEAKPVVQQPGDADRNSRGDTLPQSPSAHVGAVCEVEHAPIVHLRSSREAKEKIKKSSNAYIWRAKRVLFRVFAGFRYSG